MDGLERNAKKEEERLGVEGVDAVGEWLVDGRDITEDPRSSSSVVVVPEQDGVVTAEGCVARWTIYTRPSVI